MIASWLINTLTPKIRANFTYVKSAKRLWDNLQANYGQKNGLLVFQLKRAILNLKQCDDDLTTYYSKLQQAYDEYYKIVTACTCKSDIDHELIQFLNGLNPCYDMVRDQILLMEPLPTMSQAYAKLLQIEKQKEIKVAGELGVFNTNQKKPADKRKKSVDKRNLVCEHCKKRGHIKDSCFKLHGIPNWFKELEEKRNGNTVANVGDETEDGQKAQSTSVVDLRTLIREEMQKLMSQPPENPIAFSNAVPYHYSSNSSPHLMSVDRNNWLIDSGASCHIGTARHLFSSLTPLSVKPNKLLPDGSICTPSHAGTMNISPYIVLHHVYFVPEFQFNLLSVSFLLKFTSLTLVFYPDQCLI